ncbi:hypothetical protein [Acidipropionibacterium virtanenii]|uniref:Uncharacterized protein n=1 Tax=Acidipropionibacterium virtanenii TaxID=2057246 RepID=A0A344USD1_9ACTN|nr:hypothetical protein [Acidipropionibacterium virtanenii]AXE38179.1 hypothetical protein JS278_00996 [Acidipropionibacterium virtanenii]
MGLFNRLRPDPDLASLDTRSAERVRSLVRSCLESLGIEATVAGGHIDSSLGHLSLEQVARECADQDRGSWPVIVDEVVKRMIRSLVDGADQLSDATIGEHVVWRLLPDAERMGRSFRYARPVTGAGGELEGVVLALAWDGQETLDVLNDAALSEVRDLDVAFEAGRENLVEDLAAAAVETTQLAAGVVEITSPSWLTASWALLPAEVAERFLPEVSGVLLAAPDHQHVLVGPDTPEARTVLGSRAGRAPVLPVVAPPR